MKYLTFLFLLFSVSIFAQSVDLPDLNTVDSVRLVKRNVIENGIAKRKVQFVYIAYKATGDTINAVSPLYDSVAVVAALQSKLASGYEATASAVRAKYEALYGTSEKGNVVFSKMFSRMTKTNYPDSTFNANLSAFTGRWQAVSLNARWVDHVIVVTSNISGNAKNMNSETGTPNFNGNFRVLSNNCIETTNYFPNYTIVKNPTTTVKATPKVVRFFQTPLGIWISYDFSITLQKL